MKETLTKLIFDAYFDLFDQLSRAPSASSLAERLIAAGVIVQRMIPVTERQPDEPGEYLVWKCQKHPHYAIDVFTKSGWYGGQYVMSWMPLPPKPEVWRDA